MINEPYESAASVLQGAGFRVTRRNVDSDAPAGTVVDQQPPPGGHRAGRDDDHAQRLAPRGPTESVVPSVEGAPRRVRRRPDALEAAGFTVDVQTEVTDDPGAARVRAPTGPAGRLKSRST